MDRLGRSQTDDRLAFLHTLSRELANFLIWENPDRFLAFRKSLLRDKQWISRMSVKEQRQLHEEIAAKHPYFESFDIIGTRDYVLVPDGLSWQTTEDIEKAYRDIFHFAFARGSTDEYWGSKVISMLEDGDHLDEYVQQVKDTKLLLHIERAVELSYARDDRIYNSEHYSVKRLEHLMEIRLGIFVKPTNEYAIYSLFVHDEMDEDGNPRYSHDFYRSDANFRSEVYLRKNSSVAEWFRVGSKIR